MLLIWRGFGIVVPVITALAFLVSAAVTTVVPGLLVTAVLAGPALWFLGRRLNAAGNEHTFYFVPVQYWGPVVAASGVMLFLAGSN